MFFRIKKFMFKHKLLIPSWNLCQVVLDIFVTWLSWWNITWQNILVDCRELISKVAIRCRSLVNCLQPQELTPSLGHTQGPITWARLAQFTKTSFKAWHYMRWASQEMVKFRHCLVKNGSNNDNGSKDLAFSNLSLFILRSKHIVISQAGPVLSRESVWLSD